MASGHLHQVRIHWGLGTVDNKEIQISTRIRSDQEVSLIFDRHLEQNELAESVKWLLPVLVALLSAWDSRGRLDLAAPPNRLRAILAMELLAEARLQEAIKLLKSVPQLAEGRIAASDLGFPEFDDESDLTRAD